MAKRKLGKVSKSGFVTFKGLDEFGRVVNELAKKAPEAVLSALYDEMEVVFDKSQELCPKVTGDLRASGFLDEVDGTIVIGYTDDKALIEHEVKFDEYETPGTGDKYLERPLRDANRALNRRAAKKARQYIDSTPKPRIPKRGSKE